MKRRQARDKKRRAVADTKRLKEAKSARRAEIDRRVGEMAHELLARIEGQSPAVARNNHYVPQLYLGAWANKNGAVRYFDLERKKAYPKNIEKVAVARDFYTVEMKDGEDSDVWERLLAYIEGESNEPLERARDGAWPLSPDDRFILANFIAVQLGRGPDMRKMANDATTQVMNMIAQMKAQHPESVRADMERELGRSVTDDEVARQVEDFAEGGYVAELHNNHFLEVFPVCEQIAQVVFGMRWTLLTAARDARRFVTSDRPIAMHRPPGYSDFLGVGLQTAAYVTLPLSPRRCLRLEPATPEDTRRDNFPDFEREASAAEVEEINNMTIAYAMECVIAKLPEDRT
jgi:hypothetical protein